MPVMHMPRNYCERHNHAFCRCENEDGWEVVDTCDCGYDVCDCPKELPHGTVTSCPKCGDETVFDAMVFGHHCDRCGWDVPRFERNPWR